MGGHVIEDPLAFTVGMAVTSPSWSGDAPTIAALVSTFRRAEFLPGLFAALEAQDVPRDQFEVIVVDNGSNDGTWEQLERAVTTSPLRMCAVKVDENHGPAKGRNAGATQVRAPLIAITDDDCMPTPGWLRGMRAALSEPGVEVVQGAVHADPAGRDAMGPWDHTKWITIPTPFFETCNVGYSRDAFERVGGFDEDDPLLHPPDGRAFGEDACLAWDVQNTGGKSRFVDNAVVHHRCIDSNYRHWLTEQAKVVGFPGLARRSRLVSDWLWKGVFLDRRTAAFDLGFLGTLTAFGSRKYWPLLAWLPWLRGRVKDARFWTRGDRKALPGLVARYAVGDAVTMAKLAEGSVRYKRVVL
jgi:GT2 family glycosyltransferase